MQHVAKAKRDAAEPARKPSLARAEVIDKGTRGRFESELEVALKRRQTNEARVGGALRAIAPMSAALRGTMTDALSLMMKRGQRDRELYSAVLRSLAETEDKRAVPLLKSIFGQDEVPTNAALLAACYSRDPSLRPVLAKLAASRQSHLAFGAELARVARGESNGGHLVALAPMIKESHRISMCVELFVPLVRAEPIPSFVGPALTILRGAERHLGRWLAMAEVAVKGGDASPIEEARSKSDVGPVSARSAWSLVLWALRQTQSHAQTQGSAGSSVRCPETRPTLELIARLSDRPSADRDTTFLFRMADAGAPVCKPMLESFVKAQPIPDEVAVRAALYLFLDHGREDLLGLIREAATTAKREELRGVAAAALWDAGLFVEAREIADDLVASKVIGNVAWGALIRAADKRRPMAGTNGNGSGERSQRLLRETPLRWIQWGWLE